MPDVVINYWAVLASGVAMMIVGGLVYGPILGNKWLELVGKKKEDISKADANKSMGLMFVVALVQSFILAHFVDYTVATTWWDGVVTGFWLWLGFVAASMVGNNLFEQRKWGLVWIFLLNALLSLTIAGAILAIWV